MDRLTKGHLTALAALLLASAVLVVPPAFAAAPVLNVPGPQSVAEGNPLTFVVSATDADGQSVRLFAAQLPSGSTFADHQNNTGTFDWTPDFGQNGSYTVLFLADDTFGGTDNESVAIDVSVANNPPFLFPIGDRSVDRGTTTFVSLTGSDPDSDPLTFNAMGLPSYATFIDYGNGSANITLSPTLSTPAGPTDVTVTLSDGSDTDSETFTITVNGTQTQGPPVLAPVGNQAVNEGQVKDVALSASDPDGNTLSWTVSLPGFATLMPGNSSAGSIAATLRLTPGFCQSGSYNATIAVSDGTYQDSETFSITVSNVNRVPTWDAASYSATLAEGATANVSVSASDPDEQCGQAAPVLSLKTSDGGSALGATLSSSGNGSGTLALTASATGVGVYHVTLRQVDASNSSLGSDVVVTVTVTDVEDPPPPPALPVARAWSEANQVRLDIGKPFERFYLEPVTGFTLGEVNRSTIRLFAWDGSGSVTSITPLSDSFDPTADKDHNGVLELRMEFGKDDLRALFANMDDRVHTGMTLHYTLSDGTAMVTDVNGLVAREPKGVIKRLGPNPLNPETAVTVVTSVDGRLRVRIFDAMGRLVRTVTDQAFAPAGMHVLRFNGRTDHGETLSSGRYFVQAETGEGRDVTPLTILK